MFDRAAGCSLDQAEQGPTHNTILVYDIYKLQLILQLILHLVVISFINSIVAEMGSTAGEMAKSLLLSILSLTSDIEVN